MMTRTKIDPDVATLVVVDMQNDFCHSRGASARGGADVAQAQAMVPRLAQLLAEARANAIPVVWIQTWRDEGTDSPVWRARHSRYLEPPEGDVRTPNCIKDTWGADFYEVQPALGERVVRKARYNAFFGTELETVLRTIGRPSLLFTGVATNVCVESTLRDALFREFHVTLVEDCCVGTSTEDHQATVENVRKRFGLVCGAEEVVDAWKGRTSAERPAADAPAPPRAQSSVA
jgi:ureidoacrylate peracid hydrolase